VHAEPPKRHDLYTEVCCIKEPRVVGCPPTDREHEEAAVAIGSGSTGTSGTETISPKFSGAFVVTGGLIAVLVALYLVLNTYDAESSSTQAATATASAAAPKVGNATKVAGGKGGKGANGGTQAPQAEVSAPSTDASAVSASSVVAVLTPVMAGIVGIVGLFFGISASGSARGKEAQVEQLKVEKEIQSQ
jgi:hypothetical protein